MIFISHTKADKPLVEPIATKLAATFGRNNVFYDSWSIQPGDGIIEKMEGGLKRCEFFFLFISSDSLTSKMVSLEWQNALLQSTKGKIKIIPVRISDCSLPFLLTQNLYIDMFSLGLDDAYRQIVDVIQGTNTYNGQYREFSNIYGVVRYESPTILHIEFHAKFVTEPVPHFGIIIDNKVNNVIFECLSDAYVGSNESKKCSDDKIHSIFYVAPLRALKPNFPLRLKITSKDSDSIVFLSLIQEIKEGVFQNVKEIYDHRVDFKI